MKSVSLTIENLMEIAAGKTQLDDFGDQNFIPALSQMLSSFEKEHGDDEMKKYSFAYELTELLGKRLYIRDNFRKQPGILEIPIKRPLFITGLPRTGTTLIHNLISQGPYWRVLQYWELLYPYYREETGPDREAYFIQLTGKMIKGLNARYPALISRHETKADGPEECNHLLRTTFCSNTFAAEWDLYDYLDWYLRQDMIPSYSYYRQLLQLLLHYKHGDHLLLKCPSHLFCVDAIRKVFPDANIIWMHREPCKSVASVLSLYSVFRDRGIKYNDFIGLYIEYFKKSLDKIMDAIEEQNNITSGTGSIKTVSYKKLVKNHAPVVQEIYEQFGYPYNVEIEKALLDWLEKNPQHKHGVHRYSLENFGLTDTHIKKQFSRYYEKYGHLL